MGKINIKSLVQKYNNMPVQVKASLWFLICSFLQKGISMLSTPIFTRILSTEEYGQFNVFNSWYGIVTIFVSMNLYYGVYTQGLVKFDDDKKVFSSSLQGLSTTLVLFWTILYLIGYQFWNKLFSLTTVQMLAMLVMVWTTAVFNFWASEERVEYRYKKLVILTLLVSFAKPVLGVILVLFSEDKVTARILGLAIVELIGYSGLYFVQMRRGKKFFSAKYWKYSLLFNIPLIPHYLSQVVLSSSDRIMISSMIGDSQAGIYSLAYALSSIMVIFNSALTSTLNPWIYQKIKAKKINDIASVAYASLLIIAVVNLILILLAPEAVAIFAPNAYREAIYVIPPVALSVYFMYSYDLFAKFAFYHEKTKLIMLASVVGAVLNIVMNYLFIGWFGYMAAGYTTLACYIIYSVAHYLLMNKMCDQYYDGLRPYSVKKVLAISVPFIVMGFIFLFTYDYPLIRYGIIVVVAVVAFIKRRKIIEVVKGMLALKKESA